MIDNAVEMLVAVIQEYSAVQMAIELYKENNKHYAYGMEEAYEKARKIIGLDE